MSNWPCAVCGESLGAKRADAVYCSKACKSKAGYERNTEKACANRRRLRMKQDPEEKRLIAKRFREKIKQDTSPEGVTRRAKMLARRKAYYQKNKAKIIAAGRDWRAKNKQMLARKARLKYQRGLHQKSPLTPSVQTIVKQLNSNLTHRAHILWQPPRMVD